MCPPDMASPRTTEPTNRLAQVHREPVPDIEGMADASLDYDVETLRRFLRHRLPVANIEPLFQLLTAA